MPSGTQAPGFTRRARRLTPSYGIIIDLAYFGSVSEMRCSDGWYGDQGRKLLAGARRGPGVG